MNERKFFAVTLFDVLILSVLVCEGIVLGIKIFKLWQIAAKDKHYAVIHRNPNERRVRLDESSPELADD